MAELKIDYKDQLLDSLVNTKRVYNLVDADGNVVRENVSLEDVTVYSQNGDNFGAADINKTNEMVNQVNRNLGGLRFGVDGDGNYGYYGADDSLIPFKSGVSYVEGTIKYNGAGSGSPYSTDSVINTPMFNYLTVPSKVKNFAIYGYDANNTRYVISALEDVITSETTFDISNYESIVITAWVNLYIDYSMSLSYKLSVE